MLDFPRGRVDEEKGLEESCDVGGGVKVVGKEEESASGREIGVDGEGSTDDNEIGKAWSFFRLYLFG